LFDYFFLVNFWKKTLDSLIPVMQRKEHIRIADLARYKDEYPIQNR